MAVIVLAIAGGSERAWAGWVTIQNDTGRVLVIQTSVDCKGQIKRCKPVRLLPGESLKEFHVVPNVRLEIFPSQNSNKALFSGNLSVKPENQKFGVSESKSIEIKSIVPR